MLPPTPMLDALHTAAYVGNYTDLRELPVMAADCVRNLAGTWVSNQLYADAVVGLILVVLFALLAWRFLYAGFVAALTLVGMFALGTLLSSIYQLSVIDYPAEHAAYSRTTAAYVGIGVDIVLIAGRMLLRGLGAVFVPGS